MMKLKITMEATCWISFFVVTASAVSRLFFSNKFKPKNKSYKSYKGLTLIRKKYLDISPALT